jgi:hypothetical protein
MVKTTLKTIITETVYRNAGKSEKTDEQVWAEIESHPDFERALKEEKLNEGRQEVLTNIYAQNGFPL